jgi:hypothetical protein
METIVLVRNGRGMDLDRYVERVFSTRETAHKYENSLSRNVTILVVDGKVRKGDRLAIVGGPKTHTLASEYVRCS